MVRGEGWWGGGCRPTYSWSVGACVCVCVCVCVWRGGHMENVTREKVYNTRVHMQVAHASLSTMHVQVKAMCMCTLG